MIFVHVFPRCSQKKAAPDNEDEATADEPARLSREHLLVAAEMKTFERTVAKRCPTWSCKKRLQEKLREVRAQFTQIDAKLMNRRGRRRYLGAPRWSGAFTPSRRLVS